MVLLRSLLKTGDVFNAIVEAQRYEQTFRGYTASEAFIEGWRRALKEHPTTTKAIRQRAEDVVTRMSKSPSVVPQKVHSRVKAALRSLDMHMPFESHKREFFMLDLFPEVAEELTGLTLPAN